MEKNVPSGLLISPVACWPAKQCPEQTGILGKSQNLEGMPMVVWVVGVMGCGNASLVPGKALTWGCMDTAPVVQALDLGSVLFLPWLLFWFGSALLLGTRWCHPVLGMAEDQHLPSDREEGAVVGWRRAECLFPKHRFQTAAAPGF